MVILPIFNIGNTIGISRLNFDDEIMGHADDYSIEQCCSSCWGQTGHENPSPVFSHNHAGPDAYCLSFGIIIYYLFNLNLNLSKSQL